MSSTTRPDGGRVEMSLSFYGIVIPPHGGVGVKPARVAGPARGALTCPLRRRVRRPLVYLRQPAFDLNEPLPQRLDLRPQQADLRVARRPAGVDVRESRLLFEAAYAGLDGVKALFELAEAAFYTNHVLRRGRGLTYTRRRPPRKRPPRLPRRAPRLSATKTRPHATFWSPWASPHFRDLSQGKISTTSVITAATMSERLRMPSAPASAKTSVSRGRVLS